METTILRRSSKSLSKVAIFLWRSLKVAWGSSSLAGIGEFLPGCGSHVFFNPARNFQKKSSWESSNCHEVFGFGSAGPFLEHWLKVCPVTEPRSSEGGLFEVVSVVSGWVVAPGAVGPEGVVF
jgi:hypothetical protein